MNKYLIRANAIILRLKSNCTNETICENYGQDRKRKFLDKITSEKDYQNLTYQEQCTIKHRFDCISRIAPQY